MIPDNGRNGLYILHVSPHSLLLQALLIEAVQPRWKVFDVPTRNRA